MADLGKIKRNVAKMVSMEAPEEDIDQYISGEGVSLDEVRNFKVSTEPKSLPGISNYGVVEEKIKQRPDLLSEVGEEFKQHPFKSIINAQYNTPKGIANQFKTMGGLYQRTEAIPANIGRSIQKGDINIKNPLFSREIKQAVSGEQLGALSDIPERIGVDPTVSKAIGLGAMAGIGNLMSTGKVAPALQTKGLVGSIKKDLVDVKNISKFVASKLPGAKGRAVKAELKGYQTSLGVEKDIGGRILSPSTLPRKIQEKIATEKIKVKQLTDKIDEQMNFDAQNVLEPKIKSRLPKIFKEGGTHYKEKLDEASNLMVERGDGITRSEIEKLLQSTIDDAEGAMLPDGKPIEAIHSLKVKYSSNPELKKLPEDNISLQQFKQDVSDVYKSLSTRVKGGYGYNPEDVVGASLLDKWGTFIAEKSPEFAQLQTEYRPVVQAMKATQKLFKPNANPFEKTKGAGYLVQYALDRANNKLSQSQAALMKFIEEGTSFTPGMGNITKQLTDFATSKAQAGKDLSKLVTTLAEQKTNVQDLLSLQNEIFQRQEKIRKALIWGGAAVSGMFGIGHLIEAITHQSK